MINYIDKGQGLSQRIQAAGHCLRLENGAFTSSDDAAVQALIDGYTLDDAKAFKQSEIARHAKALRDKVVADISAGEMSSWPIKLAEARAHIANGADAPMLSAEAIARGVDLAALCAKVIAQAGRFAAAEAAISGVDGLHRDAVAACETFAAVAAYDYSTGWMEV